jgi:hypothetical protein
VITLTQSGATAQIDFGSQRGLFSLGYSNQNVANQQWFWFRVASMAPEASLETIGPAIVLSSNSNSVSVLYSNAQVQVALDYTLNASLLVGFDLQSALTIVNPTATPLDFHLFLYSDFPLSAGDTVLLVPGINQRFEEARQASNVRQLVTTVIPNADHGQVDLPGAIPALLTNSGPDILNDYSGPLGPGRVTWAFQWDLNVPATSSTSVQLDHAFMVPPLPVIAPIPDCVIGAGQCLRFTNSVQDYFPPVGFSLGTGFQQDGPAGASVDQNGVFRWCPTPDQAGTTNLIKIVVDDANMPVGWSTQNFTVVVRDYAQASLGATSLGTGETSSVPVNLFSSAALTNVSFNIFLSPEWLGNPNLTALAPGIATSSLSPVSPGVWHANLAATAGQFLQGTQLLANLAFTAVPGPGSAFVPLPLSNLVATRSDGSLVPDVAGGVGQAVVLGAAPLLDLPHGSPPALTLYGQPGTTYVLDYRTDLASAAPWVSWTQAVLSARSAQFASPFSNVPSLFYRARTAR